MIELNDKSSINSLLCSNSGILKTFGTKNKLKKFAMYNTTFEDKDL